MSLSKNLYAKLRNIPNSFEKLLEHMEEASEKRTEARYLWKIEARSFDNANIPSRQDLAKVIPGFGSYRTAQKRASYLNTMTKELRMSYPYCSEKFRYEVVPIR